ncbi:Lrp/AsnC family transcriptional regulator [Kushneria phosphatilytica]|uniref:Lrp/AsnC family transcriptional regulator n=1 Tax=Kushneria phosphatilytica TaxID=657387 RepID=A0A1S1NTP4_9GAMM|nr:Lrp/AsnC family transcriptional regulator [Kushneria phosphatilytica]OHV07705.1 transcriptional regulator [Kushneria phosphatilytica]QEL10202.1 Lrp/AsnC family transcriptional regulator [Kushneria phosphatilytica]
MTSVKLDQYNLAILRTLQQHPALAQREVAERIHLSQNACWRRMKQLEAAGVIRGTRVVLGREALGIDLVVFTMIRTRNHSADWLAAFRTHILDIPEVSDFYRISGDYDYLLKIVTRDIASFDRVYQRLIDGFEIDTVTSCFVMEVLAEDRPLAL